MPRRPALYPRPRWQWAEDLPDAETDWASLLLLNDVSFLTENQVSLWTSPEHPGVGRVRFYPVPRAPHLDSDRFDMNRIASESVHVLAGPSYEVFRHGELIALDVVEAMWLPSHIRRTLESPDIQITETISIYEDTVVIQVTPVGETAGLSIRWQASTERTRAASWRSYDHTQV